MIYFDKKIISVIPKIISGFLIVAFVSVFAFATAPLHSKAAFNEEINYQGKLTNASNVPVADGVYEMMFRLYTVETGGSPIWTEDRSTAPGDRVTVSNGLFSVMLGSSTPLSTVDFNQPLYLTVEVEGDGEMTPRKVLGAVPAAFTADRVDGLSSEQFLRSDAVNSTSTATTFLTITQNGAGNIAEFIGPSSAPVLNLLSNGRVAVGTSTPYGKFSVWGSGTGTGVLANFVNSASTTLFSILENGTIATPGLTLVGNESIGHTLTTQGPFTADFAGAVTINGETASGRGPRMHLGYGSYGWAMTYADPSVTLADPSLLSGQDGSGVTGGAVLINAGHGLLDDNGGALLLNAGRSDGAGNGGDVTISSGSVGGISGIGGDIILQLGNAPTMGSILLQGGNVGIGTTSPYAKLSVAGQVVADYFTATTTTASTFPYASTTALTVSGTNGLQLASALNGPLQAVNGLVSATSTLSIAYGGTGVSTAPAYGEILVGNGTGGYTLTATTSLGITSSQWVTSGNNIYNSNTANVGIGTTSPYSKLSVWGGSTGSTTIAEFVNSASSTIFSVTGNGQLNLKGTAALPNFRIYNNNTDTFLSGLALTGGDVHISGNPNVADAEAGSVFIYGALGTFGDTALTSGSVYIGTTAVSRPATGPVVAQAEQNFLGVGGMMTVGDYAQFNSNIIVGGASANPTAAGASTISLQGQAARSIGVERNWTAATAGNSLTINAGGARSASTNLTGGGLILRSGVPTGTGTSTITFGTYGGGSSGTADGTVTNSLILAHNQATFAHGVSVAVGTTTPWGSLSVGSHNLAVTTPSFVIASSSTGVATSTQFIVRNGFVGIGTTSPYAKLSVAGQVVADYFTATTTTASTFPYASTTALTVSGTNGLQLAAALNGPLQAVNGLVSATSTLSIAYGGTGVSTAPAYGEILVGNGTGGYTLTATTSLGISGGSSQWTTAGSDIYYTTGNVGVGTTSPFAKLSVSTAAQQDGGLSLFNVASTTNATLFTVLGNGNVGIGTSTVSSSFAVESRTTEETGLSLIGNINSYYQGNIQNTSSGASASSDWVATANNGSETTHYIDMGINGSGGGATPFTTANHAYLYSVDDTLNIGALGASADIRFFTTGGIASPVEQMRIATTGNVGVGTTSPWGRLSVTNTGTGPSFVVEDSTSPDSTPFVVDASGNVGIGIAAPTATLDVVSGTTGTVRAAIFEGWSSGVTRFNFNNNIGLSLASSRSVNWSSGSNPTTGLDSGLSRIGVGVIAAGNGTVGDTSGTLVARSIGVGGTTTPWARLSVGTHDLAVTTPAFVIASSSTGVATSTQFIVRNGNVGVATTSPWRTLSVVGTVAFNGLTSSVTGNAVCITTGKDITDAGAASCVPSSIRFKENVETLSEGFALDTLNQLRVVSFDYKEGFYSPEDHKESYGMIAEEVEEIDPNLVDYGHDGQPMTLKFEKILGLTVQAVQELQHNFRLTGGPDGNIGSLAMGSILENLKNLGVDIRDGVAYVKSLVVQTLTVGSEEKPTGITLYDEKTGKPFCVKISAGKLKNVSGKCEDAPDELDEEGGIEAEEPQTGRVRSGGSSAGSAVPAPEPIVEAVTELEGGGDNSEVRQQENEDDNGGTSDGESDESDSSNQIGVGAVSVSDASSAEPSI